ncbi:MAG: NAD-dependent deacylase [Proteobacteria bacterium]|nr:NAD-dependent deacylase [Pseudomonadota bacterium]
MTIPDKLLGALRDAQQVCVLTGSGISAESGVPTFRDAQTGLWEQYDPHELATPDAFQRDPALVWRWYRWRRELVASVEPNAGHHALVKLAGLVPALTIITQNVDGLHQRAGSENIIEFHGNLFENRCFVEGCTVTNADMSAEVPVCTGCGAMLRPGVVWFGESIPEAAMHAAESAVHGCDLFFSIGTSSLVWPAAGFAEAARQQGASVVEINLDATPLSSQADFCLQGKSGTLLPELVNCLTVK